METMQNAEGKEREGELERNGKERGKGKERGPRNEGVCERRGREGQTGHGSRGAD